jgi:hypothetical protein
MNTTTTQTAPHTHIDAVRATYSENTATVKRMLGFSDEDYFEIISVLGFKFLKKHLLFDDLKSNPLFWNWLRLRISKSERMFLSRFTEPELRSRLRIAYMCLIEFEVLNSFNTKQSFNTYLKILRNENVG